MYATMRTLFFGVDQMTASERRSNQPRSPSRAEGKSNAVGLRWASVFHPDSPDKTITKVPWGGGTVMDLT